MRDTFAGVNNFRYSNDGLKLTESFEGCKLTAYPDGKGVLTIGYGHTGKEVVEGLVWNQQQAEYALSLDIGWASAVVNKLVTFELNQHQFDALVDFVFNDGASAFAKSKLLGYVNAGNLQAADAEFNKWVYSGGKLISGLVRRRAAEAKLFLE